MVDRDQTFARPSCPCMAAAEMAKKMAELAKSLPAHVTTILADEPPSRSTADAHLFSAPPPAPSSGKAKEWSASPSSEELQENPLAGLLGNYRSARLHMRSRCSSTGTPMHACMLLVCLFMHSLFVRCSEPHPAHAGLAPSNRFASCAHYMQ